jgi:formylglycine-generating enzyme required for sulfatase activity
MDHIFGVSSMDVARILPPPFAWCPIPAGSVSLSLTVQAGPFPVDRFDMATYPITNAQFQVFLGASDGYTNPAWWEFSPKALDWHARNGPQDTPFAGEELPRVVVSWYEAMAFCFWLSARAGESISLPTEQEWQWAAQGDDSRQFPWGNEYNKARCNTSETGIKRPTPVMKYPNGASPYGVLDLSGNVAEWCLNAYNIPDDVDIRSFPGGDKRASRGGSWGISQFSARVASRGFNDPADRFEFQGFRIARHNTAD